MRIGDYHRVKIYGFRRWKTGSKIFFPSWSKKLRGNQMAHITFFYVWGNAYRAFSPVKRVLFLLIFHWHSSVCNIIKIGFQDCLLNQITYKRWLRNLCGELCGIESMQSKNTKEKTASRFVPEISLVRCAHLFDFRYYQLVRKIPYGQTFHEVFSIDWIVIIALDSSSVYDIHKLSMEIKPCQFEKML